MARGSRVAWIQHLSHPHALQYIHSPSEYKCDACKENSYGFRYRCPNSGACDFDLHESCARAPQSIFHASHPQHNLTLFTSSSNHVCDICGKGIGGFRYCCHSGPCNFCMHPACAHLPNEVTHALHPLHTLAITRVDASAVCKVCGEFCSNCMAYCCAVGGCNFSLHIACAKLPVDPLEEVRVQSMELNDVVQPPPDSIRINTVGDSTRNREMSEVEMRMHLLRMEQRMQTANRMAHIATAGGRNAVALTSDNWRYVWR